MMNELKIEHVLLFGIVAFLLYHLMGKCGCSGNGFSVGAQVESCDCSKKWTGRIVKNGPITTHDDICADGRKTNDGRPRHFCTDQPDLESCGTAGGRSDYVGPGTCKWNGSPTPPGPPTTPAPTPTPTPTPTPSCINYNTKNWCDDMLGCMWDGFTCKSGPPPSPPPPAGPIIRCNPNIKPPQICPGGRPCPQNGKCVLPILCKPGATDVCPDWPWTCPPNGMCPGNARP